MQSTHFKTYPSCRYCDLINEIAGHYANATKLYPDFVVETRELIKYFINRCQDPQRVKNNFERIVTKLNGSMEEIRKCSQNSTSQKLDVASSLRLIDETYGDFTELIALIPGNQRLPSIRTHVVSALKYGLEDQNQLICKNAVDQWDHLMSDLMQILID
jgi:hypothetical protein